MSCYLTYRILMITLGFCSRQIFAGYKHQNLYLSMRLVSVPQFVEQTQVPIEPLIYGRSLQQLGQVLSQ